MVNVFGWVATMLSLVGFYANVKKAKWCFVVWAVADVILIGTSVVTCAWYLVFLYFAYLVLAVWGYWKWTK